MTTSKKPLLNSLPHVGLPQLPDVDSDHVLHLLWGHGGLLGRHVPARHTKEPL